MKQKIDLIKEEIKEENCVEVEVFAYNGITHRVHTDYINYVGDSINDAPEEAIATWEAMNEKEYNNSICANCDSIDFGGWLGNKDGKVMVVILKEDWDN